LTWSINQILDIRLEKEPDLSVHDKKNKRDDLYSFYGFYDENEHIEYYLIKNISNHYKLFIPEKDQVDYFLVIKNHGDFLSDDFLKKLKSSESILTAFQFEPEDLKSKTNLIF